MLLTLLWNNFFYPLCPKMLRFFGISSGLWPTPRNTKVIVSSLFFSSFTDTFGFVVVLHKPAWAKIQLSDRWSLWSTERLIVKSMTAGYAQVMFLQNKSKSWAPHCCVSQVVVLSICCFSPPIVCRITATTIALTQTCMLQTSDESCFYMAIHAWYYLVNQVFQLFLFNQWK